MPPEQITEETIAAARLRLVLDEKLDRVTPDRVRQIADMPRPPEQSQPSKEEASPPEGLLPAGAFGPAAQRALARQPMSLLLIELDDAPGGVTQAVVMRVLGSLVRGVTGPEALLAQVSPAGFGALVVDDGPADRILSAVRAQDWSALVGAEQSVRVSVAVVDAEPGDSYERVRNRAQAALSIARTQGGDRVVTAQVGRTGHPGEIGLNHLAGGCVGPSVALPRHA